MTARNEKLGQESLEKIINKYPERVNDIIFHQLDITDKTSVDNFLKWIKENQDKFIHG
jgi:hypothetical protein